MRDAPAHRHTDPRERKLDVPVPPNRANCATIAFLERDRLDAPRASDAYGDIVIVGVRRRARRESKPSSLRSNRPRLELEINLRDGHASI
jgi:hypothetical protein